VTKVKKVKAASFSLLNLMEPLNQAPCVIPQLILSLCAISIVTYNKLLKLMLPFNGDKIRPRLMVKEGNKTFSCAFDTGASVICIKGQLFEMAISAKNMENFRRSKLCCHTRRQNVFTGCVRSGLVDKRKNFMHPVNVINELNENIIGIAFIHAHKLTYDILSRQMKFAGTFVNSNATFKHTILPAMTSTVAKAKYKGKKNQAHFMWSTFAHHGCP
jgi:hypothetical protein